MIVPAFGDAGRITLNSIHYAGNAATGYVPVGETEFARDATFGYRCSDLREWVEEKSGGRIPAGDVAAITLDEIRTGPDAVAAKLMPLTGGRCVVVDIIEESDLRSLALGLLKAQGAGKRYVFRVAALRPRYDRAGCSPATDSERCGYYSQCRICLRRIDRRRFARRPDHPAAQCPA